MKPPPFEYVRPVDLDGVLGALAQNSGETKILAGGQSLVPMMNLRLVAPKRLVDINRVPGLDRISRDGDRLLIGGLARHTDVLTSPVVREYAPLVVAAYRHVAHRPIRNRGTIGGNLAHADPASELPAVMLALDAEFVLRSLAGERQVAAERFFLGTFETAARADEVLTAIHIPLAAGSRRWGFEETSQRQGDFALVAVAVTFAVDGGRCANPRLRVCRCRRPRRAKRRCRSRAGGPEPGRDPFRTGGGQSGGSRRPAGGSPCRRRVSPRSRPRPDATSIAFSTSPASA